MLAILIVALVSFVVAFLVFFEVMTPEAAEQLLLAFCVLAFVVSGFIGRKR